MSTGALATILTLVAIFSGILGWILKGLKGSMAVGEYKANVENKLTGHTADIQGLHAAFSMMKDKLDKRQEEYWKFRLKVAKHLGINGGDDE
jgi:hypothetical protein